MRTRLVAAGVAGTVAAAVIAAVFLTRPADVGVNSGPLGGGPVDASVCFADRAVVSVSGDDLRNVTSSPIHLESFTLVGARGLRVLGVYLVPIVSNADGGGTLMPTGGSWPVSRKDATVSPNARWSERRTLPMTMLPDKPGRSWNPVFGVRRTAEIGTAATYRIQYEWRGRQYTWSSATSLKVATRESQCPTPGSP